MALRCDARSHYMKWIFYIVKTECGARLTMAV